MYINIHENYVQSEFRIAESSDFSSKTSYIVY